MLAPTTAHQILKSHLWKDFTLFLRSRYAHNWCLVKPTPSRKTNFRSNILKDKQRLLPKNRKVVNAPRITWRTFKNGLSNWSPVALEGFVNWTSTITGPSNPNFFSPLQSTTPSNRWAMLDSDGNGTTGFEEHSELRMNASIDLTGATNTQLSFKQMHRAFNNDTTSVAVSGDGGSTWTTFVINELLPPNQSTANPETITFDISSIADNSPNVRLAFYLERWIRLRVADWRYWN